MIRGIGKASNSCPNRHGTASYTRSIPSGSRRGGLFLSNKMLLATILILLQALTTTAGSPTAISSTKANSPRRRHARSLERDESFTVHLNVEDNFAAERTAVGEAASGGSNPPASTSSSGRLINIPINPTITVDLNNTSTADDGVNTTTPIVDENGNDSDDGITNANGEGNTTNSNATVISDENTTISDGITINVPTDDILTNSTMDNNINDSNNNTASTNGTLTNNSTNGIADVPADSNATDLTNATIGVNVNSTTLLTSDFPSLVPSPTPTSSPQVAENDDDPELVPAPSQPPQPRFVVDPNDSKFLICNAINGHKNNDGIEEQQEKRSEYLVRVKFSYKIWIEEDKIDGDKDSSNNLSALTNTIYDIHAIMAEYVAGNVLDCDGSTSTSRKDEPNSTGETRRRKLLRGKQHSPDQVEQSRLPYRKLTGDDGSGNDDSIVKGVYGVSTIPPPTSNDELLPMIIPRQCTHHSNTFADNTFDHECYEILDMFMTLKSNGDSFLLPDITCGVLRALRTTDFLVFLIQSIPNSRLEAFHIPDDFLPDECRSDGDGIDRLDGNSNDDDSSIGSEVAVPVMIGIAIGTTMASILACCVVWYSVCYMRRRKNDTRDDSNRSGGNSSSGGSTESRRGRHRRGRGGGRRRRLRHGSSSNNDGSEKDVFVFEDEFNEDDDDANTVETLVSPHSVSTEGTSGTNRSVPTPTHATSTSPSVANQQDGSGDVKVKSKSLYVSTMNDVDNNGNSSNNKENNGDLLGATAPHYHDNPKKIKKLEDNGTPSPRNRKTKTLKVTRRKKKKSNQNPFILNASRSASGRSSPNSPGALLHASMMSATAGTNTTPPPPSGPPSPQQQGGLAAYLYGILTPIKEADDSANEVSSQASSTKTDNSNSTPLSNLLDNVLRVGRRGNGSSVSSCSSSSVNSASDNDDDENDDGAEKSQPVEAVSLLGIISFDDDGDDERSDNDNDEYFDVDAEEQLDDVYEIPTQQEQSTSAGVAAVSVDQQTDDNEGGEDDNGEAMEPTKSDSDSHNLAVVASNANKEGVDADSMGTAVDDLGATPGGTTTETADALPAENDSVAPETTEAATEPVVTSTNDASRDSNVAVDEERQEEADLITFSEDPDETQ